MSKASAQKILDGLHEAIGLSRASNVLDKCLNPDHVRLHVGELSAQEMRTVMAVLRAVRGDLGRPDPAPIPFPKKDRDGHD